MARKIIQVHMQGDLIKAPDAEASRRGESRASLIREACAGYLAASQKKMLIPDDVRSYARYAETTADSEWRIRNAGEVWGDEDWDPDDI
jgi:hypothetical protein